MSHNFKAYASEQDYILPPSLLDLLPEDELAWFVIDGSIGGNALIVVNLPKKFPSRRETNRIFARGSLNYEEWTVIFGLP